MRAQQDDSFILARSHRHRRGAPLRQLRVAVRRGLSPNLYALINQHLCLEKQSLVLLTQSAHI